MTESVNEPYDDCFPAEAQVQDDAPDEQISDSDNLFEDAFNALLAEIWTHPAASFLPFATGGRVAQSFQLPISKKRMGKTDLPQPQLLDATKRSTKAYDRHLNPLQREYLTTTGLEKTPLAKPILVKKSSCSEPQSPHTNERLKLDPIARAIARHEGSPTSINWNDNGAGISVGMFQANQCRGELPTLLQKMDAANPQLFSQFFADDFQKIVRTCPGAIRSIAFTNPERKGPNALGVALEKALREPAFQEVQVQMLADKIHHASCVAAEYGITSQMGVALVADMINQLGEGEAGTLEPEKGARKYLRFALGESDETLKLKSVAEHDLKGYGRPRRDRDILADSTLADASLNGCDQSPQPQKIAIESKADHRADGDIGDI